MLIPPAVAVSRVQLLASSIQKDPLGAGSTPAGDQCYSVNLILNVDAGVNTLYILVSVLPR
jgi:hypothetical protein